MYDNVVVVGICSRTFFYEKAGVKSRMGLYQLYIEKQRRL